MQSRAEFTGSRTVLSAECATTVVFGRSSRAVPFYEHVSSVSEMIAAADRAARHSSRFFDHRGPGEFTLHRRVRRLSSPYGSPHRENIGLLGASLGLSYVVLAAAHDSRFPVTILHIRPALEPRMDLDGCKAVAMLCGHRALGATPFKFLDACHICTLMKENLQVL